MVVLRVIKEVGKPGSEYHLAVGKVIEVREDTAKALQDAYPDCFEAGEEPATKKVSQKEVQHG